MMITTVRPPGEPPAGLMEVMTGKNDQVGVGVGVAAESSPRLLSPGGAEAG
jgi:hypothetical protein